MEFKAALLAQKDIDKLIDDSIRQFADGATLRSVLATNIGVLINRFCQIMSTEDKIKPLFVPGFHPQSELVIRILRTYLVASPQNWAQHERNALLTKAVNRLLALDDPDFKEGTGI